MQSLFRLSVRARRRTALLLSTGLVLFTVLPMLARPGGASAASAILAPPQTLEGSLSVEQAHAESFFPTEGTFGKYDVTSTLSKLKFGKGAQGPYTLIGGTISSSGFDLTQSVASPLGICDATYHFAPDTTQPLFGDLAFNETNGHAHATLALGFADSGAITTATGCGPNNEFTSNVFGQPIRIRFSITAEGSWDQQIGTATFDASDANSHRYLGGTEVDVVRGKLAGGLQIFYEENNRFVNVTDETTKVPVGQHIRLRARFADGSTPKLSDGGWTGMTNQTAVGNYDFYDSFARTYPLEQTELTSPDISFYWVKAPNEAIEGSGYTVSVAGLNRKTGEDETAETTFDVVAPIVQTFSATTCGAGINRTFRDLAKHFDPPEMSLGVNDTSPGCRGVPGVAWTIDVALPSITGGHVAMTQLVTETLKHNRTTCTQGGFLMSGARTIADGGRAYGGVEPSIDAGGEWKTDPDNFNDSPSVGLKHGGTWFKADTFSDYIMFRPDASGSIWVPLAQMGPWTWSGTATEGKEFWSLSAHQDPSTSLPSSPAPTLPEWNGVIGLFTPILPC